MDRVFVKHLWAAHILKRKSVSRIVTEALAAYFSLDPAEVPRLATDEGWKPRVPRSSKHGGPRA